MNDDSEFEQRSNVRWESDFGPSTPTWRRYLAAVLCMGAVLGFLGFAVFGLPEKPRAGSDGPDLWVFALVVGLIIVIALRGERWAIRVRHFFEGRRTRPEDLE